MQIYFNGNKPLLISLFHNQVAFSLFSRFIFSSIAICWIISSWKYFTFQLYHNKSYFIFQNSESLNISSLKAAEHHLLCSIFLPFLFLDDLQDCQGCLSCVAATLIVYGENLKNGQKLSPPPLITSFGTGTWVTT